MTELEYLQSSNEIDVLEWLLDFDSMMTALRATGNFKSTRFVGGEVKRIDTVRDMLIREHKEREDEDVTW